MSERALATEPPPTPVSTINDFIPEGRDLSECISSIPKPGCGSDARSDWAQGALFGVLIAALVFIAWRIVRSTRRSRSVRHIVSTRPDADPANSTRDVSDTS